MDLSLPPDAEAFRVELRAWLDTNVPEDLRGAQFVSAPDAQTLTRLRAWNRRVADAGYAAIAWPADYGGRGAPLTHTIVLMEEFHRAGAPASLNPIGISNIAPAILQFGTEEQKRTLLPAMRSGEHIWCQGFSEPDAGSDLASLRTKAVRDGDHYVVTGQKVWNTLGAVADWCELLVRTDPDAPNHKGISCLLVDMTLPGITVSPLVTITGDSEFAEIFFDEVRVPVDALLGPEHQGWMVAMATLAHERGGVANLHLMLRAKVAEVIDLARTTEVDGRPASEHPVIRQRLAELYVGAEHLKLLADRAISGAINGRAMGPESSIAKLVWSNTEQRLAEVAADIAGDAAMSGRWARERIYCRALSIAGGTTQVNKNILATRMLGLPRS